MANTKKKVAKEKALKVKKPVEKVKVKDLDLENNEIHVTKRLNRIKRFR